MRGSGDVPRLVAGTAIDRIGSDLTGVIWKLSEIGQWLCDGRGDGCWRVVSASELFRFITVASRLSDSIDYRAVTLA
eukprot:2389499-Rhodomonas_salina.2